PVDPGGEARRPAERRRPAENLQKRLLDGVLGVRDAPEQIAGDRLHAGGMPAIETLEGEPIPAPRRLEQLFVRWRRGFRFPAWQRNLLRQRSEPTRHRQRSVTLRPSTRPS